MTRPVSDDAARYLTVIGSARQKREIGIDASSDQLIYRGRVGVSHEVVDASSSQAVTGKRCPVERTTSETDTLTAAESGKVFICLASSGTQVFTLPLAATAGMEFTFVCGHADSEIRVAVGTGDNIVGKTSGAEDGTGISTTVTTGLLLNTASGNVVGDHVKLVSDGVTTWYMTSIAGAWSAA